MGAHVRTTYLKGHCRLDMEKESMLISWIRRLTGIIVRYKHTLNRPEVDKLGQYLAMSDSQLRVEGTQFKLTRTMRSRKIVPPLPAQ